MHAQKTINSTELQNLSKRCTSFEDLKIILEAFEQTEVQYKIILNYDSLNIKTKKERCKETDINKLSENQENNDNQPKETKIQFENANTESKTKLDKIDPEIEKLKNELHKFKIENQKLSTDKDILRRALIIVNGKNEELEYKNKTINENIVLLKDELKNKTKIQSDLLAERETMKRVYLRYNSEEKKEDKQIHVNRSLTKSENDFRRIERLLSTLNEHNLFTRNRNEDIKNVFKIANKYSKN